MGPKVTLVATVKDEAAYLGEWIAHHRAIGVTNFLIYQNDSFDNTVRLLRQLNRSGVIDYFNNPNRKSAWQNQAYRRASRTEIYQESDWVLTLDADEFLCPNTAEGTIASIVENIDDNVGHIEFDRVTFGCGGHVPICGGSVTETFKECSNPYVKRRIPIGFKSMHRPSFYRRSGIHSPKVALKENIDFVNGSGTRVDNNELEHKIYSDPLRGVLGVVNHYPIRDIQNFILKVSRGSASNTDREVGLNYFDFNNGAGFFDDRIDRHIENMKESYRALISESGAVIEAIRKRGINLRKKRFANLMNDESLSKLYQELLQKNPTQQAGFSNAKFLLKPTSAQQ